MRKEKYSKYNKIPRQIELNVINDYLIKFNMPQIGRRYKISHQSVRNILIRNGIKLRTLSEATKKYSCDESFFEKINTPEKAYFLGWMYSDGNISRKTNGELRGFEIALSGDDELEVLKKLKDLIKFTGTIRQKKKTKESHKQCHRMMIGSKKMAEDLIKLGCFAAKSLILEFPTEEQVPDDLISHFLLGMTEGDGCISFKRDKSLLVGLLTSRQFAVKFKEYIEKKLKIPVGLYNYDEKPHNSDIKFSGLNAIQFLDFIYKDASIVLKRKKDVYNNYIYYIKERLEKKEGFACLEQDYVKELCEYFGYKYSDDFQYSLSLDIRNNICNDYENGMTCKAIRIKHKVSNSLIVRILVRAGIYKNFNTKFAKSTLDIQNKIELDLNK